jgi:hypothetical protein
MYLLSFHQEAQMTARRHHPHHHFRFLWFLWPFKALWLLVTTILEMTGRLIGMVVGFVFIVVGIVISLTVIGAIVGIPLAIIGLLLVLRGIF